MKERKRGKSQREKTMFLDWFILELCKDMSDFETPRNISVVFILF